MTRNVLGARGIDRISITENSATTHGYPLYDGHGNCRAILTRDGTDDYATGNWRTYDVWGSVRSGSATGDPKSRYVASIGHVADDESSLIYMRARYYEPATGRFISQDPALDGANWYVYCRNNPVLLQDESGLAPDEQDWVYLTRIVISLIASELFMTTFIAAVGAGFLVGTSLLWGFGWYIPLSLAAIHVYRAGLGALHIYQAQQHWLPSIEKLDTDGYRWKKGKLFETLGFLNGWYAFLAILFKYVGTDEFR